MCVCVSVFLEMKPRAWNTLGQFSTTELCWDQDGLFSFVSFLICVVFACVIKSINSPICSASGCLDLCLLVSRDRFWVSCAVSSFAPTFCSLVFILCSRSYEMSLPVRREICMQSFREEPLRLRQGVRPKKKLNHRDGIKSS